MSGKKILLADDDEAIQICMADISEQEKWDLSFASNGEECLEKIRAENPALVILDQRMPKMTGEEVLLALEQEGRKPKVILISAEQNLAHMQRFPFVVQVLRKPFDLDVFINAVNQALPT